MNDIKVLREKVKDLKLLFVDDEEAVRKGTGTFLKKFFDDVTVCSNGDEALNVFKQNGGFKIVISDVLMPKMDGITMVKEIKKLNPDIFTIFLTASRESRDLDESLGNIILQKPLSFKNMIFIMEELSKIK